MAGGWARDGAVQDQIDDTIADAVRRARSDILSGDAAKYCVECGEEIPEARRRASPGTRACLACQSIRDAAPINLGINRRGSKNSQLRQW